MSAHQIVLQQVGKRFNQDWVFRGVDHTFRSDRPTVILGANGSGKSTLLQVILGSLLASEGTLTYMVNGREMPIEACLGRFSLATPYLELIEEYTLLELLAFHQSMVGFKAGMSIPRIVDVLDLGDARNKAVRFYSSGMKQRVKIGLALLSDTPFVLLDEPTSNLDATAMEWYNGLVDEFKHGRVLIVCSNDQKNEFSFCTERLNIMDHKPRSAGSEP